MGRAVQPTGSALFMQIIRGGVSCITRRPPTKASRPMRSGGDIPPRAPKYQRLARNLGSGRPGGSFGFHFGSGVSSRVRVSKGSQ